MWYVLNPTTQIQGWKETGWLGKTVAGAIQRKGITATYGSSAGGSGRTNSMPASGSAAATSGGGGAGAPGAVEAADGPGTIMGNKWQQAGAFAIDGMGRVVWACKARSADDVLDLEDAIRSLLA